MITPNGWWELNIDKEKAEAAFAKAGLPAPYWVNRMPMFASKDDYNTAEQIVASMGDNNDAPNVKRKRNRR